MMSAPSLRIAVQVAALLFAYQSFAQSPSWRDGTLENLPPPVMGSWREDRARQQERDREQVESMREFRRSESTWVWTETRVPDSSGQPSDQGIILFRGTPSGRTPNR
jgi:hypothetical protein